MQLRDPQQATNLAELCEILNEWSEAIAADDGPDDYACDLTSLPTFGGDDLDDTSEVWSWDADSVLVDGPEIAVGHSGWQIQLRCPDCGEATFHCDCDHDD